MKVFGSHGILTPWKMCETEVSVYQKSGLHIYIYMYTYIQEGGYARVTFFHLHFLSTKT